MSNPNDLNVLQPLGGGKGNEYPTPIRWIVMMWRWAASGAGKLGLYQPHAPHWFIALFTLLLVVFAYRAWDEIHQDYQGTPRPVGRDTGGYLDSQPRMDRCSIHVFTSPVENGKPLDFAIWLVNTGRTPALHALVKFHEFTIPDIFWIEVAMTPMKNRKCEMSPAMA